MSLQGTTEAFGGGDSLSVELLTKIGTATQRLDEIATEMAKAKTEDTARFDALNEERQEQAKTLSELKTAHDVALRQQALDEAVAWAQAEKAALAGRQPSKAQSIGTSRSDAERKLNPGDFLTGVFMAAGRDAEMQAEGKASLKGMADHEASWGKATLGTTDATGGWVIPNAVVDEFITPATVDNIYRTLMTVVPGVTASTVDIPFRIAARARAVIAAFGATKENVDLVYNGYTATMYTLARIYDVSNQFLRQSRGAAERDVLSELAAAFAQGEAYYIREGSGSSEPFGYTSALTNGPAAFRSTFTPSSTTLAGSIAKAVATASGALAGRGVKPTAAVLSAASYWNMVSQGTDTAGFFFAPLNGPEGIRPGTLMAPFGLPVYADPAADLQGTAAVVDNLVVANWKQFKVYFGESYRVDSSDQAGTRWDTNLTGFRGEEEMGFDARPTVYAGHAQMITDIEP